MSEVPLYPCGRALGMEPWAWGPGRRALGIALQGLLKIKNTHSPSLGWSFAPCRTTVGP